MFDDFFSQSISTEFVWPKVIAEYFEDIAMRILGSICRESCIGTFFESNGQKCISNGVHFLYR